MLTNLQPQPEDKIIALIAAFRADKRAEKIDLGVGVYKDASGVTPVMRAVKAAEKQLVAEQTSKSYVGLTGDPKFTAAMAGLLFGDDVDMSSMAAAATPGGTGAVRLAFELAQLLNPKTRVWVSMPTWPNHPAIVKYLGIELKEYRYFDTETGEVDLAGMLEDLSDVREGDVVLLHGCCHNPTGANLTSADWDQVIAKVRDTKALAMVDIAYQGFGDGLDDDAAFTRKIVSELPEVLIAASCSKNFGVYRERTGILFAKVPNADLKPVAQANLASLNRLNYSFPPDHGAKVVTMILQDDALRADWQAELEDMRQGMLDLRVMLADELRKRTNSNRFDFVAEHRGMFSRLGLSPEQVEQLRSDHAVYMIGDSRINIAGLNKTSVPILAEAIAQVL